MPNPRDPLGFQQRGLGTPLIGNILVRSNDVRHFTLIPDEDLELNQDIAQISIGRFEPAFDLRGTMPVQSFLLGLFVSGYVLSHHTGTDMSGRGVVAFKAQDFAERPIHEDSVACTIKIGISALSEFLRSLEKKADIGPAEVFGSHSRNNAGRQPESRSGDSAGIRPVIGPTAQDKLDTVRTASCNQMNIVKMRSRLQAFAHRALELPLAVGILVSKTQRANNAFGSKAGDFSKRRRERERRARGVRFPFENKLGCR
ncbi:hypothetical protein [Nisaea sp.]|uniref:hypothetical protein n=1 Tax=Nisaea sp. TaxID=2024842 RepID=UPI003B52A819